MQKDKEIILVSACLIGVPCRYNGTSALNEKLLEELREEVILAICPEVISGLGIPRIPFELPSLNYEKIIEGKEKILNKDNKDITDSILKGLFEIIEIVKLMRVKKAYLKEKSPCCGVSYIYINGIKKNGMGIFTYLLTKNGIKVFGW